MDSTNQQAQAAPQIDQAPSTPTPEERKALFTESVDESLERDLRSALGITDEAPQAAQQPNTAEAQTQQTPSEPVVEIDGEKVPLSQVKAWKTQGLLMADYTKKTQALAEERRKLEQDRARLQPLLSVDEKLQQDPALRQRFTLAMKQVGVAPTEPDPRDKRLAALEQLEAERQLDNELFSVRQTADRERKEMGLGAMTDAEWEQMQTALMQMALQQRTPVSVAYRFLPLRDQWVKDALAAAKKSATEQHRQQSASVASTVLSGSPRGGVTTAVPPTPKDLQDATRMAYADLKSQGVSLWTPE